MAEFQQGTRIYIDSNIWIYYVEGHDAFMKQIRNLFLSIDAAMAVLVTSEIAVAECLYKPWQDGNMDALQAYDGLFSSGEIELVPLDSATIRMAAEQGGQLGLKLVDAMHYVSALTNGCNQFITSDGRFKSGPAMQVIRLTAQPVA